MVAQGWGGGEEERWGKGQLGSWDGHVHTVIFKMGSTKVLL